MKHKHEQRTIQADPTSRQREIPVRLGATLRTCGATYVCEGLLHNGATIAAPRRSRRHQSDSENPYPTVRRTTTIVQAQHAVKLWWGWKGDAMTTARASTRDEALRLLNASGIAVVELDYESGWQDAVELGRLGQKAGVRVEFRGHESIAVKSPAALTAGLARAKTTFRQRNLYCQFDLDRLPAGELKRLEAKAERLGDYILGGHLLRDVDAVWAE